MNQQELIMGAAFALTLENFTNEILASANNGLTGFGKLAESNQSYQGFLTYDLIKEDGKPVAREPLLSALSLVISRRVESGEWG